MTTVGNGAARDTACARCDKDHKRQSPECPARRVGTVLDDRYRLDHLIGSGGCGAVFGATHLRLGSKVAVKMLLPRLARDPELSRRFLREAQTTAALSHEGIVKVTDYGTAPDAAPYLVMEHVAAASLAAYGKAAPLPSLAEVAAIGTKVLAALSAAHQVGIVHRDIKPENILYFPKGPKGGQIKIVDFGLAKVAEATDTNLTETGRFFGTLNYASPEQMANSKNVDARTDIYSAGAVLYFLLTGQSPAGGGALPAIINRVLLGEIERHPRQLRPEIPPWLDAIVARALSRHARDRFGTADEMAAEIERHCPGPESDHALLTLSLISSGKGGSYGPSDAGWRSRTGPAVAGGVLFLLLATAVYLRRPVGAGALPSVPPGRPGMVSIPASSFTMGSTDAEIAAAFVWCRELAPSGCDLAVYERERPTRVVSLSAFAIDATEVTNAAFASWLDTVPRLVIDSGRFVRADGDLLVDLHPAFSGLAAESGHVRPRPGQGQRPVVQVTWAAARSFCKAQGKRLPTEAEWERAARGSSSGTFPWGDRRPDCENAVFARGAGGACASPDGGAADVGTTAGDRSPEGVLDLAGNVSEWVEDSFQPVLPACPAPCRDPVVRGAGTEKSCRGGNWGALAEMCRAAGRGRRAAAEVSHQIGFRCAWSP